MGVETFTAKQLVEGYRAYPQDKHGKFRMQYFELEATDVAGDANSTVDLALLPPGRVRVVPALSRLNHSAFGAGRTLDIGHRAYDTRDSGLPADQVAADPDAFADGLDVENAGVGVAFGAVTKFDLWSKAGVPVFATVLGDTIPLGATLSGFIAYLYE